MRLGWRLFRQVLWLVFGNLLTVAQLSLLLTAVPVVFALAASPEIFISQYAVVPDGSDVPLENVYLPALVALILVSHLCAIWIAVGWHRFILLEERPNVLWPYFRGRRMLAYLGRLIQLYLIVFLCYWVIVTAVMALTVGGIIDAEDPTLLTAIVTPFALLIIVVLARLSLVLPAAALGRSFGVKDSFRETRGLTNAIVVLLILLFLLPMLIWVPIVLLIDDLRVEAVAGVFVTWIATLLTLAVPTVLYGHLVEARPID